MDGRKSWENLTRGRKDEISTEPVLEIITEDIERDLKLLKDRIDDPEEVDEDLTLQAVERLLNLIEKNLDVKSKLESYLNEYKEGEETETEERLIKNDSIYKKIEEGLKKQRLGKFYYDKNDPRRKLGS